jgi:hypothetical protein
MARILGRSCWQVNVHAVDFESPRSGQRQALTLRAGNTDQNGLVRRLGRFLTERGPWAIVCHFMGPP